MKPSMMPVVVLAGLGLVARCPAGDDYSFFFTVSNEVSPSQPSTTVTVWAAFDPQWYAFHRSHTEVESDPDVGAFSDPVVLLEFGEAGDVAPDGDRVWGIDFHQWEGFGGLFADTGNPIAVWSTTWTTDDFTPRSVPILTTSVDFYVYVDIDGTWQNFYGPDFSEAQGFINILGGCYPDFTGDGVLDLFDFLAYVNAFNAGDAAADCDHNGALDLFDFLCFVNAFNAGC